MHIKETCKQTEKTTFRMRENIGKWSMWQGTNIQNTETDHSGQDQGNK